MITTDVTNSPTMDVIMIVFLNIVLFGIGGAFLSMAIADRKSAWRSPRILKMFLMLAFIAAGIIVDMMHHGYIVFHD